MSSAGFPAWKQGRRTARSKIPTPAERLAQQHVGVEAGAAGIDPPAAVDGDTPSLEFLPRHFGLVAVAEGGVTAAEIGIARQPICMPQSPLLWPYPTRLSLVRLCSARSLNPQVRILARAHLDDEVEYLKDLGSDAVFMGEREIARRMIEDLARVHVPAPTARRTDTS